MSQFWLSTFSEGRFDRFYCTAVERGKLITYFAFIPRLVLAFLLSDNYMERETRKVQDGEEEDVQEEVPLCWTQPGNVR